MTALARELRLALEWLDLLCGDWPHDGSGFSLAWRMRVLDRTAWVMEHMPNNWNGRIGMRLALKAAGTEVPWPTPPGPHDLPRVVPHWPAPMFPPPDWKVEAEGLREALAEYAHEAWAGWMDYLFEKSAENGATVTIPAWAVARWKRQAATPYPNLSDEEKDSDRREADRMLALIAGVRCISASADGTVRCQRERGHGGSCRLALASAPPPIAPAPSETNPLPLLSPHEQSEKQE